VEERKKAWTADEAAPYWTSPAEIGEERLRERVSDSVGQIFRNVP
jgi:hypothetical protein